MSRRAWKSSLSPTGSASAGWSANRSATSWLTLSRNLGHDKIELSSGGGWWRDWWRAVMACRQLSTDEEIGLSLSVDIGSLYNFRIHVEHHPERDRKLRIAAAISSQCVSRAKWPVSKKRTSAAGMSRLNASAPGGRKNGSFLPQAARNGGLCLRK